MCPLNKVKTDLLIHTYIYTYTHITKGKGDRFPVTLSFTDNSIVRQSNAVIFLGSSLMQGVSHNYRFARQTPSHRKYVCLDVCDLIQLCVCALSALSRKVHFAVNP